MAKKVTDKKMKTSDGEEIAKQVNRTILENALEPKSPEFPDGFDFDEAVSEYGWKTIDVMAMDLKSFLVDLGGREKYLLIKDHKKMEPEFNFIYPIITPPDSWKLTPKDSMFILDAEWEYPLGQTSEQPCEMYIYEVNGFPELIKIGIAKDSKKRHEKYYGKLLWRKSFKKSTARIVEFLFLHSTYHRANNSLPQCNVGNFFYEPALSVLKKFFDSVGHSTSGITEVRQMTIDEAESTIDYIHSLVINKDVFDTILSCGINTFDGNYVGRPTIMVKRGQTWKC